MKRENPAPSYGNISNNYNKNSLFQNNYLGDRHRSKNNDKIGSTCPLTWAKEVI